MSSTQQYDPFEPLKTSIQNAANIQSSAATGAGEDLNKAYTTSAQAFQGSMAQLTQMMQNVSQQNIATLTQYSNKGMQYLDPFRQAGQQSAEALNALLGSQMTKDANGNVTGYNLYQVNPNEVINGPEAQAKLALGTQAIQSTLQSTGQAQSGRALEQLFQYGHQLASTEIGAAQDRADAQIAQIQNSLLGLTGIGQQAASTQAGLATQLGTNIAQQNTNAGQAAMQLGAMGAQNTQNQSNLSAEALANARMASANAQANATSALGQVSFQQWQAGYGEGHQGIKGIGGLLGSLAGPLMGAGLEMGGLGGLGLLLGGTASAVGSQNFS